MKTHESAGKAKKTEGRVKEAAGILSGNRELEKKGSRQRTEGGVEESLGKARRKVGEALGEVADALKK